MANKVLWNNVEFHVGDTIRVHYRLFEKEKVAGRAKREVHEQTRERTQIFQGVVISIKGSGNNLMFTVRHMGSGGIGVERIFTIISPWIKKIEVKKKGRVRRAKLYYLRQKPRRLENYDDGKRVVKDSPGR